MVSRSLTVPFASKADSCTLVLPAILELEGFLLCPRFPTGRTSGIINEYHRVLLGETGQQMIIDRAFNVIDGAIP